MSPPDFTVILNPAAGARRGARLRPELEALVQSRGGLLRVTPGPGAAEALAREAAAEGAGVVFAAGGDDTVREVLRAVQGGPARLGIVPLGTFNNFAASLRLPHQPLRALEEALDGEEVAVDLGQVVGGRLFTESVGVGLDAEAWAQAPAREPEGLARWALGVRLGLRSLLRFRPKRIRLCLDGEQDELEVMQVTVANSPYFGSGIQVAPHARLDDGLLDVCVIPWMSKWQLLAAIPSLYLGRHLEILPEIRYARAREVRILARRPLPVRVDGQIATHLPITLRALPGALRMRLPSGRRPEPSPRLGDRPSPPPPA